ncbi:MAG TPA: alpha/beta fold hydrolase, partial [Turneriella sp.]|nr:alpha/beta fold hydrolase [Turneriella sp.]
FVSIPAPYGKLSMQVAGLDEGDAILFIHGWPDSHDTWSHQMEYFSKNYRVGALDLPGVGGSDAPTERVGYHIDNILPLIQKAIETLGGKKTHLVAHDWGAIISWVFASRPEYAKYIASYTAVSGPHPGLARDYLFSRLKSFDPQKIADALRQMAKSWYIYLFQLPFVADYVLGNFGRAVWPRALMQGGVPEKDPMLNASNEEIARIAVNPLNLYRELIQGKWLEVPTRIDTKVQVIIPKEDLAITPEIYSNVLEVAPHAVMHYLDANHWVQRSHPSLVNQYLEMFIRQ